MRVDQIMVNPCKSPFEFRQVQRVHHKHMAILANSSSFFDTGGLPKSSARISGAACSTGRISNSQDFDHDWWLIPTPLKNDGVKVNWDDDIPNTSI